MAREFIIPGHIINGEGALKLAADSIATMGNKALIVTDKVMVDLGNVAQLTGVLEEKNIQYVVYDGISGEPTDKMIEAGLSLYLDHQCDFLIGLGGGSPLDSMKAVGALVTNGGNISDYMGKVITKKIPNTVAIPTTAGTGSEATQFTIISDTQKDIKMLLKGAVLMPTLAVIDPQFTITAPPKITAATGLDALTHAVEAYSSRKAQSLSDSFALSAIRRIFKYLPIAYTDGQNVEAREQMSIAALEAGIAFNNASVTIVHGMSRPIGALFHVPHGLSNAMLMKECFTFALDGAYDKFADMARAIEIVDKNMDDKTAAHKMLDAIVEICKKLDTPSLEEYGIDKEKFFSLIPKMAKDAVDSGSPGNTIKEVGVADVEAIYKKLWD